MSHEDYRKLLMELRELPGIKKVFIRSGLRFDYILYDKDDRFLTDLAKYHISGQLKVAPEHVSNKVLRLMGKPDHALFEEFVKKYNAVNRRLNKDQYIVPYLMSSHPGSDMGAAIELAMYLKKNHMRPEQVQDFYPTPATLSTTMYYTGIDPRTMKKVYVPKTFEEKNAQRAMLQYYKVENHPAIRAALIKAGRRDLIGYGDNCLVPPEKQQNDKAGRKDRQSNKRNLHCNKKRRR